MTIFGSRVGILITMATLATGAGYLLFPPDWQTAAGPDPDLGQFSVVSTWTVMRLPAAELMSYLTLALVPLAFPNWIRELRWQRLYRYLAHGLLLSLLLVTMISLQRASGAQVSLEYLVLCLLGLVLFILGERLGQIRLRSDSGFRTPWTLANDEVWRRTHSFAGRLFIGAGILLVMACALRWNLPSLLLLVCVILASITLHSVFIYQRTKRGY